MSIFKRYSISLHSVLRLDLSWRKFNYHLERENRRNTVTPKCVLYVTGNRGKFLEDHSVVEN